MDDASRDRSAARRRLRRRNRRRRRAAITFTTAATVLAVVLGLFFGVSAYTFTYGEGFSYFSTDPQACVNCHIMQPYYDSWQKASHHTVAKCVDCHLPDEFVPKYIAKADNGYRHSWAFTFQNFHEPIQITARNAAILQQNCIDCHGMAVHNMLPAVTTANNAVSCVHCHADVGHGPMR